jgi:cyclophilin family peptidyl-prolyl cis-trans isomerase
MHINKILLVAVGVGLLASACGTTATTTTTTTSDATTTTVATNEPQASIPSDYAGYRSQPTACGAEQPEPVVPVQFDEPGDVSLVGTTVVTLDTSCGRIVIELSPGVAPETTNSFVFLAESGYFDGSVSHRIIPGFMMQAGDPTATGLGGPGYTLPDEFPTEEAPYTRGVVAMANAGPGTTGSQFFIMFQDVDWLGPQYTIIGEVTSGLETLEQIAAVPLGRSASSPDPSPSTPLESVYIVSASVER